MERFSKLVLVGFSLLPLACVPETAGYRDVRNITSTRVQKDVVWHQHDTNSGAQKRTRELLSRKLDADSAVQLALYNNASLQAEFAQLGVDRADWVHARRLPNPELGAAVRYGASDRPEIDLDAMLNVTELLMILWRNKAAEAGFSAGKLKLVGSVLDLAFDVRVAFHDYVAAAQQLKLRRKVLKSLQAASDMAQRLFDAGNISELSLLSQRAFYQEARVAYAQAQAALSTERERLNALLGLRGTAALGWKAEPELPEPEPVDELLSRLEQRAVERSLDLRASRRRYQAAAKQADLARAEGFIPELSAGVSAERGDGDWGVGPAVGLKLPLFYQGQGRAQRALSEMQREGHMQQALGTRLRSEARALGSRLRAAKQSTQSYRTTILPLRQRVLKEALLQYNAMNASVFQLLQAKRDQLAAEQGYVQALREYWTTRARVEQLLAGRLPPGGTSPSPPAMAGGGGPSGGHD